MLDSRKAVAAAQRQHDKAARKQLDYMSAFQQHAQTTVYRITSKLQSRFPDEFIHWTVVPNMNNLDFSVKLVELDDYGRLTKEQFSSEIDDIFSECFRDMSESLRQVSEGQGGGF